MDKFFNSYVWDTLTDNYKKEFKPFADQLFPGKFYMNITFEDFLRFCRLNCSNDNLGKDYISSHQQKKMIKKIQKIVVDINEEHSKAVDEILKKFS